MIAAAFDSLKNTDSFDDAGSTSKKDEIDERIRNAETVTRLLSLVENNKDLTRKHALKVRNINLYQQYKR